MGGEKVSPGSSHGKPRGSPPHGRGKGQFIQTRGQMRGITPAWAGKSTPASINQSSIKDHPRVGGEKANGSDAPDDDEGSPPRRRGKSSDLVGVVPGGRITPAWAGKSRPRRFWAHRSQDHPRVGGEKSVQLCERKGCPGSPPRGRGKGNAVFTFPHWSRITPAWAGKNWPTASTTSTGWDHPRMGGEKAFAASSLRRGLGSPPHGRGKAESCVCQCDNVGITPA